MLYVGIPTSERLRTIRNVVRDKIHKPLWSLEDDYGMNKYAKVPWCIFSQDLGGETLVYTDLTILIQSMCTNGALNHFSQSNQQES